MKDEANGTPKVLPPSTALVRVRCGSCRRLLPVEGMIAFEAAEHGPIWFCARCLDPPARWPAGTDPRRR